MMLVIGAVQGVLTIGSAMAGVVLLGCSFQAIVAMILISVLTGADFFPDAFLMVLVGNLIALVPVLVLAASFV